MVLHFLLLCLLHVISSSFAEFSCRNEQGESVPWFIGYKLPKATEYKSEEKLDGIPAGVQTMFMDPDQHQNPHGTIRQFTLSDRFINESSGHHLANTVQQLYGQLPEEHFKVIFNNEIPPDGQNSTTVYGNTKGMLLFDGKQGFWLIHSIPRFAPADRYVYPESEKEFGQSYLCVTFPSTQLEEIAKQLSFIEPYIYESSISASMRQLFPSLGRALEPKLNLEDPFVREANLTAVDGTIYRHFAKSRAYGKDIYSDEYGIAKSLDHQIEIHSWKKEDEKWKTGDDLWPACDDWPHMVLDVERWLKFFAKNKDGTGTSLKWRTYNDNSKWLVTLGRERGNYLCIGDVNRQRDQFTRGGGIMCVENYELKFPYARSSLEQSTCT